MTNPTTRALLIAALLLVPATGSLGAGAPRPVIEDLALEWPSPQRAVASYRVTNGFSEDAEERLRSGLTITFRHRISLEARRRMMPNPEVARVRIEVTAAYDALTRQYTLTRTLAFKGAHRKELEDVVTQRTTDSIEEMRRWMTEIEAVELYDPSGEMPEGSLRLRVESTVGRRYVLLIFPSAIGASADLIVDR